MSAATFLRVVPAAAPTPLSEKEALQQRREELRAELAALEGQIAQRSSITDRQREVLVFVSNYQALNEGRSPSLAQIRDALSLKSLNAAVKHLVLLEKKGAVARQPGKWRSIKILRAF